MLKPADMTSIDLVNYVRRRLSTKKVGHTGTLDPNAMGVMVLTLFISLSHLLSYALLHKPFLELVQMANERLNPTEEEPPSEEAAEEDANETTED